MCSSSNICAWSPPIFSDIFLPSHFREGLTITHLSEEVVLEGSNMILASTCVKAGLPWNRAYIVACKLSDFARPSLYHDISGFVLGDLRLFQHVSRASAKALKQNEVIKKNIRNIPQVCRKIFLIYKIPSIWGNGKETYPL